jgi:pantoate--beta-alanine ligase
MLKFLFWLLYLAAMLIVKHIKDLQKRQQSDNFTIGFVPTMGALHQGHISLIMQSKAENQLTVCSIFVNPTQFNDKKDFDKYPITIEQDIEKLILAGTDILFLPEVEEMYPEGLDEQKQYDIGYLDTVLDGKFRPGHFNGVSMIVHKLLEAVDPTNLYMGEKDFQQCLVVKHLIEQKKLSVQLITCPTLRESNGLAMSSRNTRLSDQGRETASTIFDCLTYIKTHQTESEFAALQAYCLAKLTNAGFEPEYLLLADADSLHLIDSFEQATNKVVLVAAKLEGVRLIDNMRM